MSDPPPFSEEQLAWLHAVLRQSSSRPPSQPPTQPDASADESQSSNEKSDSGKPYVIKTSNSSVMVRPYYYLTGYPAASTGLASATPTHLYSRCFNPHLGNPSCRFTQWPGCRHSQPHADVQPRIRVILRSSLTSRSRHHCAWEAPSQTGPGATTPFSRGYFIRYRIAICDSKSLFCDSKRTINHTISETISYLRLLLTDYAACCACYTLPSTWCLISRFYTQRSSAISLIYPATWSCRCGQLFMLSACVLHSVAVLTCTKSKKHVKSKSWPLASYWGRKCGIRHHPEDSSYGCHDTLDSIMTDWNSFKLYWLDNMQGLQQNQVWSLLLSQYKEKFLNLAHLVNILMVFSISNAEVERGFSAMRCIKIDWRSSLGEDTLDSLMRISTDGPSLEHFDPKPTVARFFSTPRRTTVLPYGSRKRTHENIDSDWIL